MAAVERNHEIFAGFVYRSGQVIDPGRAERAKLAFKDEAHFRLKLLSGEAEVANTFISPRKTGFSG